MQNVFNIQWSTAIFLISVSLFSAVVTPAFALASGQATEKSSNTLNSTKAKIGFSEHTVNSTVQKDTKTKTPSKEDSSHSPVRELSGFFKIGIAINIAMILTFAYWFVGQWRQQK